jgi:hypothetical protein
MGLRSLPSRLTVSPKPPPPDRPGRHQNLAIARLARQQPSPVYREVGRDRPPGANRTSLAKRSIRRISRCLAIHISLNSSRIGLMAWLAKPAAAHDDHACCGSPQVQIRAPARGSFSIWTVSEYVRLLGQTRSGGPAIGTTRTAQRLKRSRGRAPPPRARVGRDKRRVLSEDEELQPSFQTGASP